MTENIKRLCASFEDFEEVRMKRETFEIPSQDEIAAMIERNENFAGKRADFAKLRLYQEIKADLLEFLQVCDDVLQVKEIKPNQYEKNALISIDVSIVATFNKAETALLTAIMNKADRVVVNGTGGEFVRFSFGVENVWIE